MMLSDCEIRELTKSDTDLVAELLKQLWGYNLDRNREYFKWKHLDNPFLKKPTGIIAQSGDRIVGFRGVMPVRWISDDNKKFDILLAADSVVDSEFRKKGLFKAMNLLAMRLYKESDYKLILNLSANRNASPELKKLGWVELGEKEYIRRYSINGLINLLFERKGGNIKGELKNIRVGEYERSIHPYPEKMAILASVCAQARTGFQIDKTVEYLTWKFQNTKHQYTFFYHWVGERLDGYIVTRNGWGEMNQAVIIDWEYTDKSIFKELLQFITKAHLFGIISIWVCSLSSDEKKIIEKNGFKSNPISRYLENKYKDRSPLLIRTISEKPVESDWFLFGKDIRLLDNWNLKEIYSDGS